MSFTARRRDMPSETKVFLQNPQGQVIEPAREETLREIQNELRDFRGRFIADLFNTPIAANTNFFASDLSVPIDSAFRIYIAMSASGILSVVRTRGGTSVVEQLNGGAPLNPNCAYLFEVFYASEETINLRYSVDATILKCQVIAAIKFTG